MPPDTALYAEPNQQFVYYYFNIIYGEYLYIVFGVDMQSI